MSFIQTRETAGKAYAPGWFLANNEACSRETREIAAAGAIDGPNGGKYVPMGTIYPSNDASATGIVYEDVDVSTGDMPGSVVTRGDIYEDRLAATGLDFDAATVTSADNPATEGWYEETATDTYTASTDTVAKKSKTYYTDNTGATAVTGIEYGDNPVELGLYESDGAGGYAKSTDTQADGAKTYYEVSGVTRMSSAAKNALKALGFTFKTSPVVTRSADA